MKVSLNWVRELSGVTTKTPELIELIGTRLGAVDEVVDIGAGYSGVVIVKVIECEQHPNADKLHVCKVDDKRAIKGVKRDSRGLVQVVCGAPNVKAGMLAAWIPPGATVPSTYGKDPFVLKAIELRGIVSNGMLASPKELGLGENHEGLLELDGSAKAGADFAKTYELDDMIIDIENKMFTHRPDCFGQLGVAREIAGITHKKFTSPGWYKPGGLESAGGRVKLLVKIRNEIPKLVPSFSAVVVEGVKIGPSPVWLQASLSKLGVKPINNVVDATNYMMLLSGQPMHAYDYDKLKSGTLGVRLSKAGEKVQLLGGKQLKLDGGAIVITDGKDPIGLGGIMGGMVTEVDDSTQNIVLEAATFDMGAIRAAAFNYGLFTEAATRFSKNQSPSQPKVVMARAVELLNQLAGGSAGEVYAQQDSTREELKIEVAAGFVNGRLGTSLQPVEMRRLLENVEFEVSEAKDRLLVSYPFWRTDIKIPEDIVEEIGRLYGYEHLPLQLPRRDITPVDLEPRLDFKARLRQILSAAGANEVLTYSHVSAELLERAKQNPRRAYHLANPQSLEFEYYRISLVPSLLDKIHQNVRQGYEQFTLFELGKSHDKNYPTDGSEKVPKEFNKLAVVFAATAKNSQSQGAAFYAARAYLDFLAAKLGIVLDYEPVKSEMSLESARPFAPGRSALVADQSSGAAIGVIGEFHSSIIKNFKLPKHVSGFEVDIDALAEAAKDFSIYAPINRFPELDQDICLRMDEGVGYKDAQALITKTLADVSDQHGYLYKLTLLDIFQKPGSRQKQIAWRISLLHPQRTLVTDESTKVLDKITAAAKQQLGAVRV